MGKVVISPDIKKTSQRINFNGDVIDPRTKQVIEAKEQDFTPPTPQPVVEIPQTPPPSPPVQQPTAELSILEQIQQAKDNLKSLEELKKLKIAEKKAELELLEQ